MRASTKKPVCVIIILRSKKEVGGPHYNREGEKPQGENKKQRVFLCIYKQRARNTARGEGWENRPPCFCARKHPPQTRASSNPRLFHPRTWRARRRLLYMKQKRPPPTSPFLCVGGRMSSTRGAPINLFCSLLSAKPLVKKRTPRGGGGGRCVVWLPPLPVCMFCVCMCARTTTRADALNFSLFPCQKRVCWSKSTAPKECSSSMSSLPFVFTPAARRRRPWRRARQSRAPWWTPGSAAPRAP